MKAHVQKIILFVGILSVAFACSNKEDEIDKDGNSPDPKKLRVSFHVEDSTNYEVKMVRMDSMSVDIQQKLCGSKWLLKDFTPRGNDYLTEKVKDLDSLVFTFSPQGDVIIDRLGIIGQWSLSFWATTINNDNIFVDRHPNNIFVNILPNGIFVGRNLTFFTWNEDIRKTFFFWKYYNFVFRQEGRTLVVINSGSGKTVRYLFTPLS